MRALFVSRKSWPLLGAALAAPAVVLSLCYALRPGVERASATGTPSREVVKLSAAASAPLAASASIPSPTRFREVTQEAGIAFQHTDGSSGRRHIVEAMSTGIATFDYNGDGLIDIYFPCGAPLPGFQGPTPRHALYQNLGSWRFRDVASEAGVAITAYGLGITIGDYDNDGSPDVYLDNYGPNILFHNNRDGTFTDVTARAGVAGTTPGGNLAFKVGAGAIFLDADGDGWLDLYVGNYLELDCSKHVPRLLHGIPAYPAPGQYAPIPDNFYRNNGDGTFTDASAASGVGAYSGRSMGMTAADFDNDGDTDVFICNDVQENFLFRNTGQGTFEEVGMLVGVALSCNGETMANMGADAADYNHDGWLDLYTTNYQNQFPMLLRNLGKAMFEDVTWATDAGNGCLPYVNWGPALVDLDNDGHKDIFIANGHTEDNIDQRDRTTSYRCHNILLWNNGQGKFVNVSQACGLEDLPRHAARGTAFEDLDNDGDLDAVILNSRERPTILRNLLYEQGSRHHWLQLELRGVKTNRNGVGARVRVVAGDLAQIDEVHSGRGYQSHWGFRLHFGLGQHRHIERLEVRWIGGGVDVWENLQADRVVTITEGSSGF